MKKVVDNEKYEVYKLDISFKDSGHYTNSYILKDKKTNDGILIDPAYNAKYIEECIERTNCVLKSIYLTHCHGDHTSALEDIYDKYKKNNVKIYIHKNDKEGIFDDEKNCKYILSEPNFSVLNNENILYVLDKEVINVGDVNLEVLHTPGHTDGCSVLYEKEYNMLFTGDTLFSDCYGRTDLKSGSQKDIMKSLKIIFNKFNDDAVIYPGHGESCNLKDAKRRVCIMI